MSYNNREWDQGKDSWNDQSSWQDYPRGARTRDDDYLADGKRRKYNNGGYDTTRPYEESGYDPAYGQGQGHPRPNDQDYPTADDKLRGGPGFNKKRLVSSEASPHVIFLGLDSDFTEADLQAYLLGHGCSIESVTIIRDRSTGLSKGFGFAQFTSTEHAKAFVDPLFPFIQIPPPASHGASSAAAFYKALETGTPHNGRRVKIDYSQSASPHEKGRLGRPQQSNDGTRDIGNSQASVLLFRGLDPLSGPQAISQAMQNSSGIGKEGAKGMRRIILIKDKMTLASWGFAFVEFVDIQSAAAVLAATMSPKIHPSGFRISDRPVAASFAHPYSFQPITEYSLRDDSCLVSSAGLGGVEDTFVKYWDEASMVATLEFDVEMPVQTIEAPIAKDRKEKKKKGGESSVVIQEGPKEASILPVSDKPVTLSFNKPGLSMNKPAATGAPSSKLAPVKLGFSFAEDLNAGGGTDDQDDQDANMGDTKVAATKKVAPLIASKKTANNINKWNQVQEGLNQDAPTTAAVSSVAVQPLPVEKSKPSVITLLPEVEFEFSDIAGLTCLLCARQFKSADQLKRHNKESDLHKKNYKDANLRDVAREKVRVARAKVEHEQQQPKYRDRASERRVMHNQPEAPVSTTTSDKAKVSNRRHGGPPKPPTPPPPPLNPGKDEHNVGNKLLKMMGWTEGSGLGTNGEGRVDPIQTAIYAQGVGLGASKGKDIENLAAGGYSGYQMAQETARERYNTS